MNFNIGFPTLAGNSAISINQKEYIGKSFRILKVIHTDGELVESGEGIIIAEIEGKQILITSERAGMLKYTQPVFPGGIYFIGKSSIFCIIEDLYRITGILAEHGKIVNKGQAILRVTNTRKI
jgi:hypothetical protein